MSGGGSSSIAHNKIIAVLDHDPEAEAEFARRASQYPTMYAFHGTGADCIYSLQRNGLRNLSNTGLMTAGAAYGPGIYISCNISTAQGYSKSMNSSFRGRTYNQSA